MTIYRVDIDVTERRTYRVEAETEDEAIERAEALADRDRDEDVFDFAHESSELAGCEEEG